MSIPLPLLPLIGSAVAALWLALEVARRRGPGTRFFFWLMAAVSLWSATSVLHWVSGDLAAKVAWSQIQYIGIASVPPLWLLFVAEYTGAPWVRDRRLRAGLAAMGILTFAMALTNDWHRLVWPDITMRADGAAVYSHGLWFWLSAAHHYTLLVIGTFVLVQALRQTTGPPRARLLAVIVGCVIPWALNVLYLSGWLTPDGFDTTPVGFAATGALTAWALYRANLFDVIPIAREQLVDRLADAVIVLGPSRQVLDMNAMARQMAGHPPVWLGRSVDDVLPFLRDVKFEGAEDAPTISGVVHDGSSHYEARTTGVRIGTGDVAAWLVQLRDISDQRRAEEERATLERRIHEQQKRESLSVLAGGLAHDFNNLLAGIVGNADLLALKVSPLSEMGSSVGAILLGAQRAADIVSKMLAYAGERHGASETMDLDFVVREMLDLLQTSVARHCELRYSGQPVSIVADPVQVRQVAMNLIINASEAVEEDSGLIDVSVGTGQLTATQIASMRFGEDAAPGEYAYIEVRDNGQGMDAATCAKICTPFFTTKDNGHGLGLAAVQGIVRGHGGAMQVESRQGHGSCFQVWLPLGQKDRDRNQPGGSANRATEPAALEASASKG